MLHGRMTILAHERYRAFIKRRKDHGAALVINDLANVDLTVFTHCVDRDIEDAARENFFRIDEFGCVRHRVAQVAKFIGSLVRQVALSNSGDLRLQNPLRFADEIERTVDYDEPANGRHLLSDAQRITY